MNQNYTKLLGFIAIFGVLSCQSGSCWGSKNYDECFEDCTFGCEVITTTERGYEDSLFTCIPDCLDANCPSIYVKFSGPNSDPQDAGNLDSGVRDAGFTGNIRCVETCVTGQTYIEQCNSDFECCVVLCNS